MNCGECLEEATGHCPAPHPFCERCFKDNGGCPTCIKIDLPRLTDAQDGERAMIEARISTIERLQAEFDIVELRLSRTKDMELPYHAWPLVGDDVSECAPVDCEPPPLRCARASLAVVEENSLMVVDYGGINSNFSLIDSKESRALPRGNKPVFLTKLSSCGTKSRYYGCGNLITLDSANNSAELIDMTNFCKTRISCVLINFDFHGFCFQVAPFDRYHYRIIDLGKKIAIGFVIGAGDDTIDYIADVNGNDIIVVLHGGTVRRICGAADPILNRGTQLSIARKQLDYRTEELEFADRFSLESSPLDLTFVDSIIGQLFLVSEIGFPWNGTETIFAKDTDCGRLIVTRNLDREFDFLMVLVPLDGPTKECYYKCFDGNQPDQKLIGLELEFEFGKIRVVNGPTFTDDGNGNLRSD